MRALAFCVFFWIGLTVDSLVLADAMPNELSLVTEKVIAFKDGHFLIIKRGKAVANEKGEVFTDDVPDAAVLGTFWATPSQGRLIGMHAGWTEIDSTTEQVAGCRDTFEILMANKGKVAKIETRDKTILNGTIHEVLVLNTKVAAFDPSTAIDPHLQSMMAHLSSFRPARLEATHALHEPAGNSFVLRTEESDVFLNVSDVRSIAVKDMNTSLKKKVKSHRKSKRLTFTVEKPGQAAELVVMYFRPGIRWIPTYQIQLPTEKNAKSDTGGKTAEIVLQAEILNEAEDLKNVPIDIVVGVPNFRFRETVSPMVLEAHLKNTLREAAPNLMGQMSNSLGNAMFSQRAGEFRNSNVRTEGTSDDTSLSVPPELTAVGAQDLFVYQLAPCTIAKGERCTRTVFKATCPYRDIYTWDIKIHRNNLDTAPSGSGVVSPLTLAKNEVWHQIELKNNTSLPWTTGAAMIMQGNQPLSQDLLTYTSSQNICRVPLTVAVDLRGTFDEAEVGRTLSSLTWDNRHYAKIEKAANVHLRNNKKIEVEVEIRLRLGGRITEASDQGAIELAPFRPEDWSSYEGSSAVNNSSEVRWTTKLAPGAKFDPKIQYHYFTRH